MKFRELAWAAYMYNVVTDDKPYNDLFCQGDLLMRLRQNPKTVADEEMNKCVLGFLRKWRGRHISKDETVALPPIRNTIFEVHDKVIALQNVRINDVDLEKHKKDIEDVFSALSNTTWKNGAGAKVHLNPTFASKLAHVLNPELFVMWDNETQERLKKRLGRKPHYYDYLRSYQEYAQEVSKDFEKLGFEPDPAGFLSTKLNHTPTKTLAKFLDEYDQMSHNQRYLNLMPPNWLFSLNI